MPSDRLTFIQKDLTELSSKTIAERLIAALVKHDGAPYPEFPPHHQYYSEAPKPASVLIPIMKIDGDWHLLLTRRNANLPEHSGQVAFPGGRADQEDESPEATALREAWEEIGIYPNDVTILGRLHNFLTITNYLVTPIVAEIPWPYKFTPAVEEVSRIFSIPLKWLSDHTNCELRHRQLPGSQELVSVFYFKEYDGEVLWGASARFTIALIQALFSDRPGTGQEW